MQLYTGLQIGREVRQAVASEKLIQGACAPVMDQTAPGGAWDARVQSQDVLADHGHSLESQLAMPWDEAGLEVNPAGQVPDQREERVKRRAEAATPNHPVAGEVIQPVAARGGAWEDIELMKIRRLWQSAVD